LPDLCPGGDHRVDSYTPQQAALLQRVRDLNGRLQTAFEAGCDVRAALQSLDPDPARYMWVDEGAGRIDALIDQASALLDAAPAIPGHRRLDGARISTGGSAARPSVAVAADGRILAAWIDWRAGAGEQVVATVRDADGDTIHPPSAISGSATDCYRPTAVFDTAGTGWLFYAKSVDGSVGVFACRLIAGGWEREQRISEGEHPAFNQEVAVHADGTLECCWQERAGDRFVIVSRRWRDGQWHSARVVSDGSDNMWDPAVAALPGGRTAFAWSAYDGRGYRIDLRMADAGGSLGPAIRLHEGDEYGLHPSLAVTPDGAVWCAFDLVTLHGHGGSGPTRLRPVEDLADRRERSGMLEAGLYLPAELVPDVVGGIRVVRVDEAGVTEAGGELARGLALGASALPRVVATVSGGLLLAYRVLRRMPLMTYYWELAAQALGPDGWGPPMTFASSDASLEEAGLAATGADVLVAWQSDGRARRISSWSEGFGGWECPHLREHYGETVWHQLHATGEVHLGRVGPIPPARPATRPVATSVVDRAEGRRWAAAERERYRTAVGDADYALYWGDLHRHSMISRCTSGDEPSLEDFYRYSWDVCEYDFWAVTDHAENSTAYQWWCIQKMADLFRVDERFVPLYGFEWTANSGHQNVIYGSTARGAPIFSSLAERSATPADLWRHLRRYPDFPAITIPHHPGSAMVPFDWSYGDPDLMRLVEIFQACRGNYEADGSFRQFADATLPGTFVLDGLRRGHRFGLIASSDHGNGASYVGAFADRLDRASVFAALQARRTLAATTRDIVVDVRIGETFMGGESQLEGPVELSAHVEAYRDLGRVEVVRNGAVVHELVPELSLPPGWIAVPLRVEFGWGMGTTDWSGSLTVEGGEILQAPYWAPEIVDVATSALRWAAVTKSLGEPYGVQRGAVELTVLGPPHAVVRVQTSAGRAHAVLGTLVQRTVEGIVRGEGLLRLQRGVGSLTTLGSRSLQFAWQDPDPSPAFYYLRAYLVDGEMAWSSPIWIDR